MGERSRSRLGGLFAELFVVFAGVLIALWADSWWQERGEKARTAAYLSSVRAEMGAAGEELDSAIVATERFQRETLSFWSSLQGDVPIPDSVPLILLQFEPASVPLGTLDALMQTADINLIEGQHLRTVLVQEHARLHALASAHDGLITHIFSAVGAQMAELERVRLRLGQPPPFPNAEAIRGNALLTASYGAHGQVLRNSLNMLRSMKESVDLILTSLMEA